MTRTAGIGIGYKSDFTGDRDKFPSPDKYNIRDFVKYNKAKKKGYIFGLSR